jgi:hypothetical protein
MQNRWQCIVTFNANTENLEALSSDIKRTITMLSYNVVVFMTDFTIISELVAVLQLVHPFLFSFLPPIHSAVCHSLSVRQSATYRLPNSFTRSGPSILHPAISHPCNYSVYLPAYPSVYLSIHPPTCLSVCMSVHQSTMYPAIHPSIYSSIYPSIHSSMKPSTNYLTICLSICEYMFLSIYVRLYLSIHPSIYPPIYLFIHLSIYLSMFSAENQSACNRADV